MSVKFSKFVTDMVAGFRPKKALFAGIRVESTGRGVHRKPRPALLLYE
jgi:hypothetical protein